MPTTSLVNLSQTLSEHVAKHIQVKQDDAD